MYHEDTNKDVYKRQDYDQIKAELTAVGGYIENEDSTAIPVSYTHLLYFLSSININRLRRISCVYRIDITVYGEYAYDVTSV